jgi:hypothetical protein
MGRIRVEQAHAIGPDEPASTLANLVQQRRFPRSPLGAAFTEPRADDADGPYPLLDAIIHHRQNILGANHYDREVDIAGIALTRG